MSQDPADAIIPQQAMIAAFERAARIYCVKTGVDPDVEVAEPHPALAGVVLRRFYWEIIAERMADLGMLLTAMKNGGTPAITPAVTH